MGVRSATTCKKRSQPVNPGRALSPREAYVEALWREICEDPFLDRERRELGRLLLKLGVKVDPS